MPPKSKTPAPIDRPLSRAYLRNFTGWSSAFPPGNSEPTSLRIMENMLVDRNGALTVRPGMKYLSYTTSPDIDPAEDNVPGIAIDRPLVGMQEPFYVSTGEKALLFAVRETDNTVGFRAILFTGSQTVVLPLTDDRIGFTFPQGEAALRFSAGTTHVEYLQIDNKILALSDKGEDARLFFVGAEKMGKRLSSISMPQWQDDHKLIVRHPDGAWILTQGLTSRRNEVYNPSFESGGDFWSKSALGSWRTISTTPFSGTSKLELSSAPTRTNMAFSPLHAVETTGTIGWYPDTEWELPKLSVVDDYMKIEHSGSSDTFFCYSTKLTHGVVAGQKYRLAFNFLLSSNVQPKALLTFYNASGAKIGNATHLETSKTAGRYISPAVLAPSGAVAMRIHLGGHSGTGATVYVKMKDLVLCKDGEATSIFTGSSTSDATHKYFWIGDVNKSASVDHPAVDITLTCDRVPVKPNQPYWASLYLASATAKAWAFRARSYDKDAKEIAGYDSTGNATVGGAWVRASAGTAGAAATTVTADMQLTITAVARGEVIYVDAAMIESGVGAPGIYFDGSTAATTTATNAWADPAKPHKTYSVQTIKAQPATVPPAETPTTKTLIASGGAANNPYKIGFFYTFSNDVGESAASKILEVRTLRPWDNWIWETPSATGEPSGTATAVAELCADQLACIIPQPVYEQAVAEGAIKWSLYMFGWSDQQPVPVVAQIVGEKSIYPDDGAALRVPALSYADGGWIAVTPARKLGLNDALLPTISNRENYSRPPKARTGLVAGDRLIVLGDPDALATIRWTSNRPGEYTNFTTSRGGGSKTLTSGNLNIPASVVLWQNPQSVDTLTILCMSLDGMSVSYYMMPASVNAQSGSVGIMGFEETTSTPGTVSPYASEVLNNALYRPTDKALMKSTAQNYNINHKTQSDKIENMWRALRSKEWIMSAQLNNWIIFQVNNPFGEVLAPGCRGNELWVFDIAGDTGIWSRFLVQSAALRVLTVGGKEYMGVTRPEGLYYLDPDTGVDDWVVTDTLDPDYLKVLQRPIPWYFETNTQGANRAHDAWAHLQHVQITMGNFQGTMRYGVRGQDLNRQTINASKLFTDNKPVPDDGTTWDVDDVLQIRRDMKEWFLYGGSVEGVASFGRVAYVQYRYTPVSVNVGYEYGSIETFEYGRNVADGPDGYADNGIPLPVPDYTRP